MPNQSKRCNVVFPVLFGPWFRSFLSGFPTKVRCAVRRLSGQLCLGGEYQEQNSAVSYSSWLVLKSEIEIQITSNKKPVNWILYNHSKRQQKPSLPPILHVQFFPSNFGCRTRYKAPVANVVALACTKMLLALRLSVFYGFLWFPVRTS